MILDEAILGVTKMVEAVTVFLYLGHGRKD